ncbi:MAG: response regulator [Parachlamydiaceae bacterium]|nr:response regulator [Parachlamydiaceae bacterium]
MQDEVLIVEDNPTNSALAEKILHHFGFKTAVAAHGTQALSYCETHQPSLILMDISLPDMDGIEVTRRLRLKQEYQATPIIAVSTNVMKEVQLAILRSGFNAFLTTPYQPNDLVNMVRREIESAEKKGIA